ncbi:PIN domain-like protein [Armillaria borealis]|uniref:PIN domain-like protein n=1 Tax=Armillaria borealis TaxID=47425 RepID=A0AA39K945_9AGAR|nr:PIN domain-like protein [Armillaria borealis]
MGVKGFWQLIDSTKVSVPLLELAVKQGFNENSDNKHAYRLGIDASILVHAAHGIKNSSHENAGLLSLLRTCGCLFTMPIIPVFVFDGDQRPKGKRGQNVRKNTTTWEIELQQLLDVFAFEWRQAPAEAEAELASMSKAGVIDAVLSEDSDALIFGAKCVLRIEHKDKSAFDVNVYDSQSCGLTSDDMVFIALLAKGDCGPGLPGCSAKTTLELSRAGVTPPACLSV